MDSSMT